MRTYRTKLDAEGRLELPRSGPYDQRLRPGDSVEFLLAEGGIVLRRTERSPGADQAEKPQAGAR